MRQLIHRVRFLPGHAGFFLILATRIFSLGQDLLVRFVLMRDVFCLCKNALLE